MNEQKIIKNQLLQNIKYTFIVFAIILIVFDLMIYNQVAVSLYKSIDKELLSISELCQKRQFEIRLIKQISEELTKNNVLIGTKINPRLICVVRNIEGEVINSETLGQFYYDYIGEIKFNKTNIDKIYTIKIQNEYTYRAISMKTISREGQEIYLQILANVDGEEETLTNLANKILVGSFIILVVAIIGSYILSKMTLKPIMESWKKQTEFVQNAAHELRTPLTIMQGKEELLLQEPNAKIIDKSEDLNIIMKETKRLTKLIKELMILAMADSNELKMRKDKVNIDALISETIVPYQDFAQMQNKKINLDLQYNKEANLDRNKINELLVILLDNAIKYTSEEDTITVKTYQKEGRLVIEVADTGIGISKDAAKHIFERFYREDKARSRATGGTGLGLSIAHTIVKLHGGNIKIVNNEPKGTRVIVKI